MYDCPVASKINCIVVSMASYPIISSNAHMGMSIEPSNTPIYSNPAGKVSGGGGGGDGGGSGGGEISSNPGAPAREG